MKPHTYTENFYVEKLRQPDPRALDLPALWVVGICLVLLFVILAYKEQIDADFTDTGIGCIDDCIEPADAEVEAITWKA